MLSPELGELKMWQQTGRNRASDAHHSKSSCNPSSKTRLYVGYTRARSPCCCRDCYIQRFRCRDSSTQGDAISCNEPAKMTI